MNQNRKEELLTRWMDGVLSDRERNEIAPFLAAHPELEEERAGYERLREGMQAVIPAEQEPPYPDFFNAHLGRHLDGLRRKEASEPKAAATGLSRLWTLWMAPAATAALVVAFIAGVNSRSSQVPAPIAEGTAAYSPLESVTAEALQDDSLDATVIVLSGLEEIEDENLIGWNGSWVDDPEVYVVMTSLY